MSYTAQRERYAGSATPPNVAQSSSVAVVEWTQTVTLQDRVQLCDNALQLSGGARAELFSPRAPLFGPASSAPYQGVNFESPPAALAVGAAGAFLISSGGPKLRSHVGTGYREPLLYERFGTSFGGRGYSIYGDPRLDSEGSVGADAGVEQAFWDRRVALS